MNSTVDVSLTEHDRATKSVARPRYVAAGLGLALLLTAATVTNPPPPVSTCSDFACEK